MSTNTLNIVKSLACLLAFVAIIGYLNAEYKEFWREFLVMCGAWNVGAVVGRWTSKAWPFEINFNKTWTFFRKG